MPLAPHALLMTRAAGGGGAFTPADSPGMVDYWDFFDTSSISDTSGAVDSVAGQMGVLTLAGTGTSRPTTGTRTVNGLNALDFDGWNDYLFTDITDDTQPFTLYVVVQSDTNSTDINNRNLFGCYTDGSNEAAIFRQNNGGTGFWAATTWSGTVYNHSACDTNLHLLACVFNGASSIFSKDGADTSTSLSNKSLTHLALGGRNGGGNAFDGRICAAAYASAAHTGADIDDMLGYYSVLGL